MITANCLIADLTHFPVQIYIPIGILVHSHPRVWTFFYYNFHSKEREKDFPKKAINKSYGNNETYEMRRIFILFFKNIL